METIELYGGPLDGRRYSRWDLEGWPARVQFSGPPDPDAETLGDWIMSIFTAPRIVYDETGRFADDGVPIYQYRP